jgi:hypothetical protein
MDSTLAVLGLVAKAVQLGKVLHTSRTVEEVTGVFVPSKPPRKNRNGYILNLGDAQVEVHPRTHAKGSVIHVR